MDIDNTSSSQSEPIVHTPPTGSPLPPPGEAAPVQPQVIPLTATEPAGKVPPGDGSPGVLHEVLSTVGILATAFIIALLMISFVFRSYQVDGPSMQNTLQNGDKLIIWKVPRTWARFTHHTYIPNRGDIIVFTESGLSQYGQADTKQLIKRVIGLPGDRVIVQNGSYTIYNRAHPEGFDPDRTMGYGKDIATTSGDIDITLSANQLFVSGDNRPDSLDSRTFGPINANQVIGKLAVRVFPIAKAEYF